jgi:hypothetical protein
MWLALREARRNLYYKNMTTGTINQGTVTMMRDPHWARTKADVRYVAQAANVLAGTTDEGAALDFLRLVGVGPASHCGGGYER